MIALAALAGSAAFVACGAPRLPAPSFVEQPTSALAQAKYPPPPARVEWVPAPPEDKKAKLVWLDGEWTWQGRAWGWKPGRWVAPPENAKYSPWTMVRDKLGTVWVAEGKWRDKEGRELPDPAPVLVGRPSAGTIVNPEGEEVPATPNVPPQTPQKAPPGATTDDAGPETPSRATPTGTQEDTTQAADAGASGLAGDGGAR